MSHDGRWQVDASWGWTTSGLGSANPCLARKDAKLEVEVVRPGVEPKEGESENDRDETEKSAR